MTRHSIHDVQHPTAENPDDGIVASAIDLTKVYGSKDNEVMALDHVNVEFKRGEMTAIMGLPVPASPRSCIAWPDSTPLRPAR